MNYPITLEQFRYVMNSLGAGEKHTLQNDYYLWKGIVFSLDNNRVILRTKNETQAKGIVKQIYLKNGRYDKLGNLEKCQHYKLYSMDELLSFVLMYDGKYSKTALKEQMNEMFTDLIKNSYKEKLSDNKYIPDYNNVLYGSAEMKELIKKSNEFISLVNPFSKKNIFEENTINCFEKILIELCHVHEFRLIMQSNEVETYYIDEQFLGSGSKRYGALFTHGSETYNFCINMKTDISKIVLSIFEKERNVLYYANSGLTSSGPITFEELNWIKDCLDKANQIIKESIVDVIFDKKSENKAKWSNLVNRF